MPTANADEFLIQLQQINLTYERVIRRLENERQQFADQLGMIEILEAHARRYHTDPLLRSLNWPLSTGLDGEPPEVTVESPLRSSARKTVRYLDYLAIDSNRTTLIIVESKRPGLLLPALRDPEQQNASDGSAAIICLALRGAQVTDEWRSYLDTLCDYVQSAKDRSGYPPKRVVLTNSEWLIVFLNPERAFLSTERLSPSDVFVWEDRKALEREFVTVWQQLEYRKLLGDVPPLKRGQLVFSIDPKEITQAMHGLRVMYQSATTLFNGSLPIISMSPVIWLRATSGHWFQVEDDSNVFMLPNDPPGIQSQQLYQARLRTHINAVDQAAQQFLGEILEQLGRQLTVTRLEDHYSNGASFDVLHGVSQHGRQQDEFVVVLGNQTHFLFLQPTIPACPFHEFGKSVHAGVNPPGGPVLRRQTASPRSFFTDGEPHHCTHARVIQSKRTEISATNRERCGPRSGRDGQAFCEIARIEERLCCRTCAFQTVCEKSEVFTLPCNPSNQA